MSEGQGSPARFPNRAAYYAWARQEPRARGELVGGEFVAMAPERVAHARAKARAWAALARAIAEAGLDCEALPDGVTVEVGEDTAYEPDAVVQCGPPLPGDAIAASAPVILVEITSPATSRADMTGKFHDYMRLPSLRHYLVVVLAQRVVLHHAKDAAGRIETRIVSAGALRLDPPGVAITAQDLLG
jgi:Uma2 family endonuclease